jgi:hypothetical protein
MRKNPLSLSISTALIIILIPSLSPADRGIKTVSRFDGTAVQNKFASGVNHALIIGINRYVHHPDLSTPANDARSLADLLQNKYFFNRENIVLTY